MDAMTPWLPYLVTCFLDGYLRPEMEVFEWGCGASTSWLAGRVARVVSVEHDRKWVNKLPPDLSNVEVKLVEPEPGVVGTDKANPAHYYSESLGGVNLKAYASAIDRYETFDLILVDGRARPSCLAHAVSHVKMGGCLVLDNTERGYYLAETSHLFGDWDRMDVKGHGPRLSYPWQATVWRLA